MLQVEPEKKRGVKKRKRPDAHFILFYVVFFCPFLGPPMAYGGSQARGLIEAAAAGLHQSHSNGGPEPRLRPTPQLMATLDP